MTVTDAILEVLEDLYHTEMPEHDDAHWVAADLVLDLIATNDANEITLAIVVAAAHGARDTAEETMDLARSAAARILAIVLA